MYVVFCNLGPRLVIAQFILVSPHHHHRFVSLNPIVSRVITKKLKLLFFSRSPKRLNCQLDSRRALSSKSKWNVNKQLPSFAQFILASFTFSLYFCFTPKRLRGLQMESHEPQSCASVKLPSLCLQLIICFELLP